MKPMYLLATAAMSFSVATAATAVPLVYPNPGFEAADTGSFSAGINGRVYGYYTGARGSFTVLAGARINGVDGTPGLNNQTSVYGTKYIFGNASAGDSLVFFIDVLDTGDRFYNDKSLNADGVNHTWGQVYGGDAFVPVGFHLSFEDLFNGGDFNYNDHSFVIGVEAVPEPAAWALMIAGFGMIGVAMRRRTPAMVTA